LEDAVTHPGSKYSLGSVVNHVLMHQTVIGLEAKKQMEIAGEYPDILVACVGGGSNFGGLVLPFMKDKIDGSRKNLRVIAVEPTACPSLTKGQYAFDWGDTAKTGPVAKMYTLGHNFAPAPIHAGGLRYHGMAPIISALYDQGYLEAQAVHQNAIFEAALSFTHAEGFLMAPETAHALKAVKDEALRCKESGQSKVILFCASGHGHFDLSAYDAYLTGKLQDYEYPTEMVTACLEELPKVK
jgi:tryptophan synthase beta chain